jgi:RimJ/RimL family protein N-acetyltransferase
MRRCEQRVDHCFLAERAIRPRDITASALCRARTCNEPDMIRLPQFVTERLILRKATEPDLPEWRQNLTDYDALASFHGLCVRYAMPGKSDPRQRRRKCAITTRLKEKTGAIFVRVEQGRLVTAV